MQMQKKKSKSARKYLQKNSERAQQSDLFTKKSHRFGGNQRTTRASRTTRPVSVRQSMHLILKSKNAVGDWSFLKPRNKAIVREALAKYSKQFGARILSSANVGNHIHIHAKFHSVRSYKQFIRVISGAIALKITHASKVQPLTQLLKNKSQKKGPVRMRFWTQSPYTRFVFGITDFMKISDYITINQLEGFGHPRELAEGVVKNWDYLYDGFV